MLPLIAGYLAKVGVEVEIKPLEYAAFLSAMTTKTHAAGYLMRSGIVNPTTTLRKSFTSGQTWNPSMWADPEFDRRIEDALPPATRASARPRSRRSTARCSTRRPTCGCPRPTTSSPGGRGSRTTAASCAPARCGPAPIYARMWIDHELKKKLGFE